MSSFCYIADTPAYSLLDRELPSILCWQVNVRDRSTSILEDHLVNALETEISVLDLDSPAVKRLLALLSTTTKRALVRHPYLAGHLRGDFRMSNAQFARFIAQASLSHNNRLAAQASAAASTAHPPPAAGGKDGRSPDIPFRCLYGEDEYLPLLDSGKIFTDAMPVNGQAKAAQKLSHALAGISATSRNAYEFVCSYIWILALREHKSQRGAFSSRSFDCLPGLTLLCSPDADVTPAYAIEEALVHESIHSFLFLAESADAQLLLDPSAREQQVTSPWTGAILDLHTGVHALIVWLSLARYWFIASTAQPDSHKKLFASQRLAFIRRGFDSSSFDVFVRRIHAEIRGTTRGLVLAMVEDFLDWQRT